MATPRRGEEYPPRGSKFPVGSQRALEESLKPKKRGLGSYKEKGVVLCGTKKKHGGTCALAAGWGTNHPGIGKCRMHGGVAPNHVKAAAKQEHRILLGRPVEINPLDALLECIAIRYGEVMWLSEEMSRLQRSDWIEDTMMGKQFHLYARERRFAVNDVARYSQMAVSLGIAERHVKLAETYGDLLSNMIKAILDGLNLTKEQWEVAPVIVRQAMLSVNGTMVKADAGLPQLEA